MHLSEVNMVGMSVRELGRILRGAGEKRIQAACLWLEKNNLREKAVDLLDECCVE